MEINLTVCKYICSAISLLEANLRANVSRAERLVNLSREQQALEFGWQIDCSMRYVQISYAEHEHHRAFIEYFVAVFSSA